MAAHTLGLAVMEMWVRTEPSGKVRGRTVYGAQARPEDLTKYVAAQMAGAVAELLTAGRIDQEVLFNDEQLIVDHVQGAIALCRAERYVAGAAEIDRAIPTDSRMTEGRDEALLLAQAIGAAHVLVERREVCAGLAELLPANMALGKAEIAAFFCSPGV